MIRLTKRLKKSFMLSILTLFITYSTVTMTTAVENPLDSKSVIQSINTKDINGKTQILIDMDADFTYKLFKPEDPYKVVVELMNVHIGQFTNKLQVDEGGITEIIPSQIDKIDGLARLEIILSKPALEINDLKKENALILTLFEPKNRIVEEEEEELLNKSKASLQNNRETDVTVNPNEPNFKNYDKEAFEIAAEADMAKKEKWIDDYVSTLSKDVTKGDKKKNVLRKSRQNKNIHRAKKISLDFQDAELIHIFRLLADISGKNIIVHPDVKGKIPSLKLIDVPWDMALDVIIKNYGLSKSVQKNMIRIAPYQVFKKELEIKQEEAKALVELMASKARLDELEQEMITKTFKVNYANPKEIYDMIQESKPSKDDNNVDGGFMSSRGEIVIDERSRTLMVSDIPIKIEKIAELLKIIDKPTPQVIIEARIVQIETALRHTFGIQWGGFKAHAGQNDWVIGGTGNGNGQLIFPRTPALTDGTNQIPLVVNIPAAALNSALNFGFLSGENGLAGLDLRLTALENSNKGKVLSTPKVLTLDNTPAVLKEGLKVPYPVQSEDGVSTAYADVTTSISVTPHITPDGAIMMELDTKKIDLLGFDNLGVVAAPRLSDSSVITQVLIRNSDTVVIGGMFIEDNKVANSGTPYFNKIPVIKWLFSNEDKNLSEREILFFITPRIVKET